jgi:hypothetical protein
MSQAIVNHLKPGGRFITINSNPDCRCSVASMFPYGFTRENDSYEEGAAITYRFYQSATSHIAVTNYHLEKSTHEMALQSAGLSQIKWHSVKVSPKGIELHGRNYWSAILY